MKLLYLIWLLVIFCSDIVNAQKIIYVDSAAIGNNNGTSWVNAYTDFQDGIDKADSGYMIWVAKGTYQPKPDSSYHMKQGLRIYGGLRSQDTSLNQRDWIKNSTILKGNSNSVISNTKNGLDSSAIIDGFIITSGEANYGGGMLNDNSSPKLINIIFSGNKANQCGGGICNVNASSPKIINTIFRNDTAVVGGGGMANINSSSPVVTNILFTNNAAESGSEIYNSSGGGSYTNVTITSTNASAITTIGNNAVWRNSIIFGGLSRAIPSTTYCFIQNKTDTSNGNINAAGIYMKDIFVDSAHEDFHLKMGSPAIDKGNNKFLGQDDTLDLEGNRRISNSIVDIGAYEVEYKGKIIYVDCNATGLNNGTNWTDAYTDFQKGINHSDSLDNIWVAKGLYKPSIDKISFFMKNGVKIYGGFISGDTSFTQRDWKNNKTVLQGSNNSVISNDNNGLDATARLDGFTITGGNKNYLYSDGNGAGIYNRGCSPVYANLVITGNKAGYSYYTGGGAGGGGPHLYVKNTKTAIKKSTIISSLNLINNVISSDKNSTQADKVSLNLFDSLQDVGHGGGGMYNESGSPVLINVLFLKDTAFYLHNGSEVDVNNGQEIYNYSGNITCINVTMVSRMKSMNYNPVISIHSGYDSSIILKNSIIYGGGQQSCCLLFNSFMKDRSDTSNGNINAAGIFMKDIFVDSAHNDFHPKAGSPLINKGDNAALATEDTLDLDNNSRVLNDTVDIGAYEYLNKGKIIYVDSAAAGANNGTSWADAFNNFQAGINAANLLDMIWVAKATYKPENGQSFFMKNSVKIYGGFITGDTSLLQRDWKNNITVLRGNGITVIQNNNLDSTALLDGFTVRGGNNSTVYGGGMYNSYASPRITNCIITDNSVRSGGGMYNIHSDPIITNCIFSNNTSVLSGGGMCNRYSVPRIYGCTFVNNKGGNAGGALDNKFSDADLKLSVLYDNSAVLAGAINNDSSNAHITNCLLYNNSANYDKEVYNSHGSKSVFTNVTLYNSSNEDALQDDDTLTWINSIFYGKLQAKFKNSSNSFIKNFADTVNGNISSLGISLSDIFVDYSNNDFRLKKGSPLINKGNYSVLDISDTLDLDGNGRIFNDLVDIGAYEYRDNTLAVTLLNFKGKLVNGMANFTWETGVEINFNHFELQKSTDGSSFLPHGNISPKGSGSSYTYSLPQTEPTVYYRVAAVDNDGTTQYSKTLSLSQPVNDNVLFYPNPSKDYINIKTGEQGILVIYSSTGKMVKMQTLYKGVNKIDVQDMIVGVYYGLLNNKKFRFIKE